MVKDTDMKTDSDSYRGTDADSDMNSNTEPLKANLDKLGEVSDQIPQNKFCEISDPLMNCRRAQNPCE
jgi:hypothetical protein